MPVNAEKSQLTADVARALRELVDMGEQLRQACAHACGMHPTDFKALGMIQRAKDEGVAMTAGELAARLELSSGAVTYLVERLASAGYVERDSDPQDRRKVLLRATEAGAIAGVVNCAGTQQIEPLVGANWLAKPRNR